MLEEKHKNNKIKKSHLLLFGSFLIFIGIISLSLNYFIRLREEVFSDMKILMTDIIDSDKGSVANDVPVTNNVSENNNDITPVNTNKVINEVNWEKYLGILQIPKIRLKRGFYGTDSKYNNIKYNVTVVEGSDMPDVDRGNLILMAHSGSAYISFFKNLYKLDIGDTATVTYMGKDFNYSIVNIYEVPKTGLVTITRNYDKTVLTLIT